MNANIETLKKVIGIPNFKKTDLLDIALTHPSYIYENNTLNRQQQDLQEQEYRRLAILGDSILNAIVIDYLYHNFTGLNQGALTNWKSELVRREKASKFAIKLNLNKLCLLGKSQILNKAVIEDQQKGLFGELFEALLGAIYLEFERDFSQTYIWLVERFIKNAVDELIDEIQVHSEELPQDCLQAITENTSEENAELLWKMQLQANDLVAKDNKIQKLLNWIYEKSILVEPDYRQVKVRAFYLALIRVLGQGFVRNFDSAKGGSSARQFILAFERAHKLINNMFLDVAFSQNYNTDPANVIASILTLNIEPELKQALQKLQTEIPSPRENKEACEDWRQNNGHLWLEKIKNLIGHDLQFSKEEKELLNQYYETNKLLLECLKKAENVSYEVREQIQEKMLLPKHLIE